ncbi:MAG: ATP-binding protein [Sandaracinaceae bacterium]|nr:ATP-binding protein [Sandaracinaceae bacterium]
MASIGIVALVSFGAASVLGHAVLQEAHGLGINPAIASELSQALEIYRAHLVALRACAEDKAGRIASSRDLVEVIQQGDEAKVREFLKNQLAQEGEDLRTPIRLIYLAIERQNQAWVQVGREPREVEEKSISLTYPIPVGEEIQLRTILTIPTSVFERYSHAGKFVDTYESLRTRIGAIAFFYLVVYIGVLLTAVIVGITVALGMGRRLTKKVARLVDGARKVGAGNLGVKLPVEGNDEIDLLTQTFNTMVQDLRSSRERIEYLQRLAAWQDMARRLAHEIKNPLTPIQLAVQDLASRYGGDDLSFAKRLREVSQIVEEEIRTLKRLVEEFSQFARLPAPILEEQDINECIREWAISYDPRGMLPEEAVSMSQSALPTLVLELSEGAIFLPIDWSLLRKALDNLVRNAVQAIAEANIQPGVIKVITKKEEEHLRIEIHDNGPGVAPDQREKIFDPDFTTKSHGSGLGLAIVKKIVFEHGGSIECERSPLGGACFSMLLPLQGENRHPLSHNP